jgi:uncharacterized membrane protein YkvA (DUF1232 family)
MGNWQLIVLSIGAMLLLYVGFVVALVVAGRREAARAVAGFVPDCVVLFRRLLADPRVPWRKKIVLAVLILYLAMPFDLVPDFIPVAGYLDDAVIVAFVLRYVLRGAGVTMIETHWPGPRTSLNLILQLAGYPPVAADLPSTRTS